MIKRFFEYLKAVFATFACVLDESKRINEDGSWNAYWQKRNERAMRKNGKSR